jgi:hypothetical protein
VAMQIIRNGVRQSNRVVCEGDLRGASWIATSIAENVGRLERILKAATDESERKFILKLIEEERAKLKNGPKIGGPVGRAMRGYFA